MFSDNHREIPATSPLPLSLVYERLYSLLPDLLSQFDLDLILFFFNRKNLKIDTPDHLDDLDVDPLEAQYWQAGRLLQRGNFEAAMDGYLDILRQDKQFRGGEPKQILLGLFELLGDDDPLTGSYRRELAMILF